MSEEEIRNYLSGRSGTNKQPSQALTVRPVARKARSARQKPQETFKDFSATHLLCPTCKQAMPVRERIMLFLPDGDLYDYRCEKCGTSVGTRKAGR